MKTVIILVICLLGFSWCKGQANPNVWTKTYEDGFYRYLDSIMKPNQPDAGKRADYISFIIMRAKEEIPNGLKSVSKDSLQNLNIRIGREYAMKLKKEGVKYDITPFYEKWTPKIEKMFRDGFITLNQQTKAIKNINKFCDCLIEKLKKMYPDSIMVPVPQATLNKIGFDCKEIESQGN